MRVQITLFVFLLGTLFICKVSSISILNGNDEEENGIQSLNPSGNSNRMAKLLMSVSIAPTPCGPNNDGVCLPKRACGKRGGTVNPLGNCRNGYGECCLFTAMCNETIPTVELTQQVTTITNPTPVTTSCSFRIKKQTNVCQVVVRFVNYISASADINGVCSTDSFSVRGSITVEEGFTTCGILTGQNMFLAFGNSDTITLRPSFIQGLVGDGYTMVVTQVQCNSASRVPDYCLQHFHQNTNQIMSFDYPNQQQSRQAYTACIDGLTNPTRISWKRCDPLNGQPEKETFFINGGGPAPTSPNCDIDSDWVQINGRNRRCEFPQLPATLQSRVFPFTLNVNFNENERIEFPIPEELRNLDQNACNSVATVGGIRPDLMGVLSCAWQLPGTAPTDPGICVCTLTQNFVAFFGQSDFGNTGFCLQYTLS